MSSQQDQETEESYAAIAAALRAVADQQNEAGDVDAGAEADTAALTAVFSAWRRGLSALLGDMAGLAAAEGKLAAVGVVQLLLGALILVSLATLALICLEIALALLLYTLALPLLVIVLLLFGLNVVLAVVIFRLIKPLTANLTFEHTRQMLSRSETKNDLAKVPETRNQHADPAMTNG